MEPSDQDKAYLWDMLEYAGHVVAIMSGRSKLAWDSDVVTRLAIERALEIIGESARCLSNEFKSQHHDIPWKDIIGQRNILAHDYGNIDYGLLYQTAVQDVPNLVIRLKAILPGDAI